MVEIAKANCLFFITKKVAGPLHICTTTVHDFKTMWPVELLAHLC